MHSMTLITSFKEDNSGTYYCDICEEVRDPDAGVYRCEECPSFVAYFDCILLVCPSLILRVASFFNYIIML